MDTPSRKYLELAQFIREYATAHGHRLVEGKTETIAEIEAAERALAVRFPDSYRWFQLEFGDYRDGPVEIFGVQPAEEYTRNIVDENRKERSEMQPRLPMHLVAFHNSGGGDLLCFDTRRPVGGEYPVVWWDHEAGENQEPEAAAPSFLDWLETELRDIVAEERGDGGSLLDAMPYKSWMEEWLRRFPRG